VILDVRSHHVAKNALHSVPSAKLILAGKSAVSDHVGKQDCGQSPFQALVRHEVPVDFVGTSG
jgi:hypothetical protein